MNKNDELVQSGFRDVKINYKTVCVFIHIDIGVCLF